MVGFKLLAVSLLLILPALTVHADVTGNLSKGPVSRVIEVVDGDTVLLAQAIGGARQVRLVGLQAPKLALGREGFREWPLAPDAKYALEQLTLERNVTLYFGGARMDRHGRHLAHLFLDDGTWVQGRLLERGMARVYSFPDNRAVTDEMYAREQAARKARRGIWAHPFYAVRNAVPQNLNRLIGTFQLIEGKVLEAARVKGTVYLNFGTNWRDDFTVVLDQRARSLFAKAGPDPLQLKGASIRVRGWLRKRNGPAVDVTHPEQLEILAAP